MLFLMLMISCGQLSTPLLFTTPKTTGDISDQVLNCQRYLYRYYMVDLLGDGYPDIIRFNLTIGSISIAMRTNSGAVSDFTSTSQSGGYADLPDATTTRYRYWYGPTYSRLPEFALSDMNSDGFPDAILGIEGKIYGAIFNSSTQTFDSYQLWQDTGTPDATMLIGDVDGDAVSDVVMIDGGTWEVWQNVGTGQFKDQGSWLTGFNGDQYFLSDVTGDGFLDAVLIRDQNVRVGASAGAAWVEDPNPWLTLPWLTVDDIWVQDTTGDGLGDVHAALGGEWRVYYTDPNGIGFLEAPDSPYATNFGNDAEVRLLADDNGDGRPDGVVVEADGTMEEAWAGAWGFDPSTTLMSTSHHFMNTDFEGLYTSPGGSASYVPTGDTDCLPKDPNDALLDNMVNVAYYPFTIRDGVSAYLLSGETTIENTSKSDRTPATIDGSTVPYEALSDSKGNLIEIQEGSNLGIQSNTNPDCDNSPELRTEVGGFRFGYEQNSKKSGWVGACALEYDSTVEMKGPAKADFQVWRDGYGSGNRITSSTKTCKNVNKPKANFQCSGTANPRHLTISSVDVYLRFAPGSTASSYVHRGDCMNVLYDLNADWAFVEVQEGDHDLLTPEKSQGWINLRYCPKSACTEAEYLPTVTSPWKGCN